MDEIFSESSSESQHDHVPTAKDKSSWDQKIENRIKLILSLRNSPASRRMPDVASYPNFEIIAASTHCNLQSNTIKQSTNKTISIQCQICKAAVGKKYNISVKCNTPSCESYIHKDCFENAISVFRLKKLDWHCKNCQRITIFQQKISWYKKMEDLNSKLQRNKEIMLKSLNGVENVIELQRKLVDDSVQFFICEPFDLTTLFDSCDEHQVDSNINTQPQPLVPNVTEMVLEDIGTQAQSLGDGTEMEHPYKSLIDAQNNLDELHLPILKLTEKHKRKINNCLHEYLADNSSKDEFFLDISCFLPEFFYIEMIENCYLHVLEKSKMDRLKISALFAELVKSGKIHIDQYCDGLERLLSQTDDLQIDIPMIWDYLAEMLVDLIIEEVLPFERLHTCFSTLIHADHAVKVLVPLFELILNKKDNIFLQRIWKQSGLHLSNFMHSHEVENFIEDNKLDFLFEDDDDSPLRQKQLSYKEILIKLSSFIRSNSPADDIIAWVTKYVGENAEESKFIRTLATVVFENSISPFYKFIPETLAAYCKLLRKYTDGNKSRELECLLALQEVMHDLDHPQGLLLSICDKLYEDGIFSPLSYILWENCDEQEGKVEVLEQLAGFFAKLHEKD